VRQYPATPVVGYVTITSATPPSLGPGDTHQMEVRVESPVVPTAGTFPQRTVLAGRTITYQTSNAGVATVSASGLVSYVGAGAATVTATCEGVTAATVYTCVSPAAAVSTVTVTPASLALATGATGPLSAVVKDASGNVLVGRTVTWASDDTDVVTVGADSGDDSHTVTVTGAGVGSATVTATCETVASNGVACTVATVLTDGPAELPRATPSFSATLGGGTVYTPGDFATLQANVNSAVDGDVVKLTAGVTYTGHLVLPNRGTPGYVHIVSSAIASLPAKGTRVGPSHVGNMATLRAVNNNESSLQFANGARGWIVMGLIFEVRTGGGTTSRLIEIGSATATSNAQLPQDIHVNRCLATPAIGRAQRTAALHGINCSITDCYLENNGVSGTETHVIGGWNGPGPYLIDNNYLSGGSIGTLFGGVTSPANTDGARPADITITRNHYKKPLVMLGAGLALKNAFEHKVGERILFEGNVVESTPGESQFFWCNLKSDDFTVRDVVMRYNWVHDCYNGMNLTKGALNGTGALRAGRFSIHDNIMTGIGADAMATGSAWGTATIIQTNHLAETVVIRNNLLLTAVGHPVSSGAALVGSTATAACDDLDFYDNIVQNATTYGFKVTGYSSGSASINASWDGPAFLRNVMIGFPSSGYPTGNAYPANVSAVQFENATGGMDGNYRLAAGSPYKGTGAGGADPGPVVATVETKTLHSVDGDWN